MNELEPDAQDNNRRAGPASARFAEPGDLAERERQLEQVRRRFVVAPAQDTLNGRDQYFLRDAQRTLAFTDSGKTLRTERDDPAIAQSMVALAAAKGWDTLTLKGTTEFRRAAWLAASARGLQTRGFTPQAVDRAQRDELKAEQARTPRDSRARSPSGSPEPDVSAEPPLSLSRRQTVVIDSITTIMRARADSEQAIERAVAMATDRLMSERAHVGRIVQIGRAPFEHKPTNDPSFYVKLSTPNGVREVWGKDIERALADINAKVGSHIVLNYEGRQAVEVVTQQRDSAGRVTGTTILNTYRNAWSAIDLDSFKSATRTSVLAQAGRQEPTEPRLRVYDRAAPPAQSRTVPKLTPTQRVERSRG